MFSFQLAGVKGQEILPGVHLNLPFPVDLHRGFNVVQCLHLKHLLQCVTPADSLSTGVVLNPLQRLWLQRERRTDGAHRRMLGMFCSESVSFPVYRGYFRKFVHSSPRRFLGSLVVGYRLCLRSLL